MKIEESGIIMFPLPDPISSDSDLLIPALALLVATVLSVICAAESAHTTGKKQKAKITFVHDLIIASMAERVDGSQAFQHKKLGNPSGE